MRDKVKKSIAIKYNPAEENAPKIVAKGAGIVADKIIDKAVDADIAVLEDAELTEELSKLEIGDEIPPELYEVVAEILIFVNDLDKMEEKINAKM